YSIRAVSRQGRSGPSQRMRTSRGDIGEAASPGAFLRSFALRAHTETIVPQGGNVCRQTMRRRKDRILTTPCGTLPQPPELDSHAKRIAAVPGVVARQRAIGLDIVNEGEYTKGGDWLSYVDGRFGGFSGRPRKDGKPLILQGKDREQFAEFYEYATERGTLFYAPGDQMRSKRPNWVCPGPITYQAHAWLAP